jgi:hypothetical protein
MARKSSSPAHSEDTADGEGQGLFSKYYKKTVSKYLYLSVKYKSIQKQTTGKEICIYIPSRSNHEMYYCSLTVAPKEFEMSEMNHGDQRQNLSKHQGEMNRLP